MKRPPMNSEAFLTNVFEGTRNIGGIVAGGSLLGSFISEQFSILAGLLGITIGLVMLVGSAFGIGVLQSNDSKPPKKGGDAS